jgi:SAM-dependent methyltransferase
MIPWRVRNFVSEHFPLLYHVLVNRFRGNNSDHWDARLASTWGSRARNWPTKNELIKRGTSPDAAILDVGCGDGSILKSLITAGYTRLHGLEISRYAVDRLSREGLRVHLGSLAHIPLRDAFFDVVIASQVLEHIIRRRRFVLQVRRVLKPGGRAFFFVPDDCLGPIDEPEHVVKYSRASLEAFLSNYFQILTLESICDENHEVPILFAEVQKVVTP